MQYIASFVGYMRKGKIWKIGRTKNKEFEADALELLFKLKEGDKLSLMMGSTNAPLAIGASRKGVKVFQIPSPRLVSFLKIDNKDDDDKKEKKFRINLEHVLKVYQEAPHLFYPILERQTDILTIIEAWEVLSRAMEARKRYANNLRQAIWSEAITNGRFSDKKEVDLEIKRMLGSTKNEPADEGMGVLLQMENGCEKELKGITGNSPFYQHVFKPIKNVGPKLAARFTSAIELIERFKGASDLANYAGFAPSWDGHLPSRKLAKKMGRTLNRSPQLNTTCYLLQDQMFTYGAKSLLGWMMRKQIDEECPCTQEQRDANKDLKKKYGEAIRRARIKMTQYFLKDIIFPKWMEFVSQNGK